MIRVDLLIHSAGQLLTIASPSGPKTGPTLGDLGIIPDGAVAIKDSKIAMVGPSAKLRQEVQAAQEIDAQGRAVMPGFVDPHNHLLFAGSRVDEFEMRVQGATYQEIQAKGGGIMSTVRATRAASDEQLLTQSRKRLDRMLAHGTTTSETKTGYGLSVEQELRLWRLVSELDRTHPVDLIPTFLGAHVIPDEYTGRSEEYVALVIDEMLPKLERRGLAFCDVFCEANAFSVEQSRRILTKAKQLGFGLKIHADEFSRSGGAMLAAELGATSADHLIYTEPDDWAALAKAGTVAALLPSTIFGLAITPYAPAREMIAAGVAIALGTDLNPGTSWCESMPLVIAIADRYMRLSPAEAIAAATINAAYALGMGQEVGSLEVGKMGDVIILDTVNYRDLAYQFGTNPVAQVIKRGQTVWPPLPRT